MAAARARVQVRLAAEDLYDLRARARALDVDLSSYLRRLWRQGRAAEEATPSPTDMVLTQLATLVAAEHSLLMLEGILPDGARRADAFRAEAVAAAEERLEALREQLGERTKS
jgi:hypothetical protein